MQSLRGQGLNQRGGPMSHESSDAGETEGRTQSRVWVSTGLVFTECCLPLMPERVKGELEESGVREWGSC